MGRYRISEQTIERLRSFLEKKRAKEGNPNQFEWLGRDTGPGYTVETAIEELLSEAGF